MAATTIVYNIDPQKLEKYLLKLLNGEAFKLESWLPNILNAKDGASCIIERERYDYRLSQFRKHDASNYNARLFAIQNCLERMRQENMELIKMFGELKNATDRSFEANKKLE